MKDKQLEVLSFKNQVAFNKWLSRSFDKCDGLWLRIYKKDSNEETVTYQQALEVALCFGWIDGLKKTYDEKSWIQKFTPRRSKSIWSKRNTDIVKQLIEEKRMQPSGLKVVEEAKADGRWANAYTTQKNMEIPEDFLTHLKKNKKAYEFFKTLNRTNLFSIVFKLQTAKKEATRIMRMKAIISMLSKGEKFH